MPCGTKLCSNKNAKSNLTLTANILDYIYIDICLYIVIFFFLYVMSQKSELFTQLNVVNTTSTSHFCHQSELSTLKSKCL